MAKKEYIEREAFIESQQHLYCENCARRKDGKGKFVYDIGDAPCRACGIMDVLDAVEDFPAADVWPVVRGTWDEIKSGPGLYDYYFRCKVCHSNTPDKAYVIAPDYCPNCGAMMEGET